MLLTSIAGLNGTGFIPSAVLIATQEAFHFLLITVPGDDVIIPISSFLNSQRAWLAESLLLLTAS